MIVSRVAELRRLDDLLAALIRGEGGALTDLLSPLLSHLDALPVPQAAVLMGALALEPPTPGDRLPELSVGSVDDAVAAELLRYRAPGLAAPVAAAITQAAAGNPLALVELRRLLAADGTGEQAV